MRKAGAPGRPTVAAGPAKADPARCAATPAPSGPAHRRTRLRTTTHGHALPAASAALASLPARGGPHPGQSEPLARGVCEWWRCRAVRVPSSRCERAAVSTGEECPRPRAEEDGAEIRARAAAGLGRSAAGWRLCSSACCCVWEPAASTEASPADSDPLPRLLWPPCRGGRKMPVKKKRKSPGVAAAVAEDGGLKKCKISRYHLPPFRLPSFAGRREEQLAGRGSGAPGLRGSGWGGEPPPRRPAAGRRTPRRSAPDCTSCSACAPREGLRESPHLRLCVPWGVGRRDCARQLRPRPLPLVPYSLRPRPDVRPHLQVSPGPRKGHF